MKLKQFSSMGCLYAASVGIFVYLNAIGSTKWWAYVCWMIFHMLVVIFDHINSDRIDKLYDKIEELDNKIAELDKKVNKQ